MRSLKTRLRGLFGLALLLVWVVSLSSCILFEYRYPEELIKPTNTMGFHELWSLEVGRENPRWPSPTQEWLSHRSLLAVDLDSDDAEELLVALNEANQLLIVKDGQVVNRLTLEVPGEAILDLSEVIQGTHIAKITSASGVDYATGFYLSLIDLTTGKGNLLASGRHSLFTEDLDSDGEEEVIEPVPGEKGYRAVDSSGRELWRVPERIWAVIHVGDLDNDGRQELLTPDWTIIDCEDGSVTEIKKEPENTIFYAGDIDGDGEVELVAGVSETGTTVGVYDLNGKKRWGYSFYDVGYGVVGDVNGDGKKGIAVFSRDPKFRRSVPTADYWIFLFDAQGNLLWNYMVHCDELYPGAFADVNGDGKDELVFFEDRWVKGNVLHVYGSKEIK